MAKVVEGIAILAGGIALELLVPEASALVLSLEAGLIGVGASLTLGGIAGLLQTGPGSPFSIRQSAAPRVCCYGQSRVAGTIIFQYIAPVDQIQELS